MAAQIGAPLACGALGSFDRGQVLAAAAAMENETGAVLDVVHEDEVSILMLDREPIRWTGGRTAGLGWVAGDVWRPGPVDDWREAARRGACGLVLDGRRRHLHASLNGIAPLYWRADRDATHFASAVDPLARTAPRPLHVDWDAWSSILVLRYPVDGRTPFAEIRRLEPFETLHRRLGRAATRRHRWPWTEVEPTVAPDAGADRFAEAIREALRPLPGGLLCPLSGGLDSRLLLAVLAGDGRAAAALTVSDDEGEAIEEELAAPVAAALGVRHELVRADPDGYRADWEERARLVGYEWVDHAWLVPLARRLSGHGGPVPDGFAIDILGQAKGHFNTPEVLDTDRPRRARLALFDALRRFGRSDLALAPSLREPVVNRARGGFLAATRRFGGHPSQNLLSIYATRSVRGVARYPSGLLGGSRVVAPGASDEAVRAMLSVHPAEKMDGRLVNAAFERLAPAAGRQPSTAGTPRAGPSLPRRWRSDQAIAMYREVVADGPLAGLLSAELRGWLTAPEGRELSGDLRLGMEAVCLLHSWCRRYRGVLVPVDPADLAA